MSKCIFSRSDNLNIVQDYCKYCKNHYETPCVVGRRGYNYRRFRPCIFWILEGNERILKESQPLLNIIIKQLVANVRASTTMLRSGDQKSYLL